jgi:hypothetical protein
MSHKIAIVWRGDSVSRAAATPENNRYHQIFSELWALGVEAEPAIFCEEMQDEFYAQLMKVDGALVWVNPLEGDRTRERLDALLRDVAATGRFVSTHPDVILKMGVKEVLHDTRHLGWGTKTHLYRSVEEFCERFPVQLRSAGPRVIKQNRGNAGQGVWKVEWPDQSGDTAPVVTVLEARRGSMPETLRLEEFLSRCESYFGWGGCIIDQPFQARLSDGMIRCYMGADRVVGFGLQKIKALIPPPPEGPDAPAAQSGPRNMHGPDFPPLRALRAKMEAEWTPQMMKVLNIERNSLPIIWDADFLYGPRDAAGEDTYVLCEINVSCVFAIPDEAPAAIARLTVERLRTTKYPGYPGHDGL